jgi:predicted RNA binding protein YcfA (HicA-like mRNA interferase family)
MSARSDHAAIVRAAIRAGCVKVRDGKHVILRAPNGTRVVVSRSPSDHRAADNLRAMLRRAGVEVA